MSTAKLRIMVGVVVLACCGMATWLYVNRPLTVDRLGQLEIEAIASGKLSPLYEHLTERDKELLSHRKDNLVRVEQLLGGAVDGWKPTGWRRRDDFAQEQGVISFSQTLSNGTLAKPVSGQVCEVDSELRIGLQSAVISWMMLKHLPQNPRLRSESYSSHVSLLVSIAKHGPELELIGLPGLYRHVDPGAALSPWSQFSDHAWRVLRREGLTDEEIVADLKLAGVQDPIPPPD